MYVGYYQDNKNNRLLVSERIKGQRFTEEFPLILEYYVPDSNGYYEGYDGQRLKKITCPNTYILNAHKKECKDNNIKTYELNFNLPNKVLYQHFNKCEAPELHKTYIDIEVDRKGYEYLTIKQLIDKACCPINAISIYNNWQDTLYTLMLRPETLTKEQAQEICNKFDNTFLFENENQLLEGIIALFDDADVLAGYNSSRFDFPYIVRRIENVLGSGESKRLCLWGILPKEKEKVSEFGDVNIEYEFYGKWFTDYLELYKKHEQGKKESYKLNSIAEIELGEQKVQHTESLEDMYRNNYEDFIKYNRQDTMLVKKLDDKLNYINLHNAQAHDIKCSLEQTMGTVAWVDQSIINESHDNGLLIPDRIEGKNSEFNNIIPPGAYVADPIAGLYSYVFSFDMNSLYPTTMRSLNLSPETIVAQIKMDLTIPYLWNKIRTNNLWKNIGKQIPDWGAAWAGDDVWGTLEYQEIMKQSETILTIRFENGEESQATAKDIYNMIFSENSNLTISACGTIFRTDKAGLLNRIFTRWYSERKQFKKKMFEYETMEVGFEISETLKSKLNMPLNYLSENKEFDFKKLKELISNENIDEIKTFMEKYDLYISDNKIISKHKDYFKEKYDYYDLAQYVKKIQLNSSYGALLNSASVFYDFRLGCSTTLSGRKVVQHLTAEANKQLIGVYDWKGHCATYNDTDSVYCSIDNQEFRDKHPDFDYSKDKLVEFADMIGDKINESFPQYMKETFHCNDDGASLQKAGRETVCSRGLFCGKKRYALMVFDKEGFRMDTKGKPGKIKIMGIQTKRSDLNVTVKNMLKTMLEKLLTDGSKDDLLSIIRDFGYNEWDKLNPWDKGTPKACNKLEFYTNQYNETKKCSVGQVMAAINWNRMIDMYQDKMTPKILDGNKVIVCKLKPNNAFGMTSIAYPIDLEILPQWFKTLPFDEQKMEGSVIDTTIETIFGVLNWNLNMSTAMKSNDDLDGFLTYV